MLVWVVKVCYCTKHLPITIYIRLYYKMEWLCVIIDNRAKWIGNGNNFKCNPRYGHVMQTNAAMTVSADCTRATVMSAFCFPRYQVVPGRLLLLRMECETVLGVISRPGDNQDRSMCSLRLLKPPVQKAREKCTQSLQTHFFVSIALANLLLILYQQTWPNLVHRSF